MKIFGSLCAILLLTAPAAAQNVAYPVGELAAPSPASVPAKRSAMIATITGGASLGIPIQGLYDGRQYGGTPDVFFGRAPTTSQWIGFSWGYGGSPTGMWARVHYDTFPGSTCLFVLHAGHDQGWFWDSSIQTNEERYVPAAVKAFARRVVNEAHCDVLLASVPLMGENRVYADRVGLTAYDPTLHTILGTQPAHQPPAGQGTPLRYFLDATHASITYALSQRSYQRVYMAGLSGGGWSTTMMAALDPRIERSYAVSGSVPLANRAPLDGAPEGDWEQYGGVRSLGVDYLDLYLMGTVDAAGQPTRRVSLFYSGEDWCCFQEWQANDFSLALVRIAQQDGWGKVRVFIDPQATTHDIHASFADAILSDLTAP